MSGPFHSLTYPAGRGAARTGLAFPDKSPGSVRRYTVDLTAFLADAATTIQDVTAAADPTLLVAVAGRTATTLEVDVGGGSVAVPAPILVLTVTLGNGGREEVGIYQPIKPLAPVPPPAPGALIADDFGNTLTA